MGNTKIEWTKKTWNPVVGCSHTSPGCDHCYAERAAASPRLQQFDRYRQVITNKKWNGKTVMHEKTLIKPLGWKEPCMIFADSMTDLFHPTVPFDWIDKVMAVIALCPQHTFQVLTKHADRMAEYIFSVRHEPRINYAISKLLTKCTCNFVKWPLPNLWLGVTVENNDQRHRIEKLRQTPAATRFISAEPLLEGLKIREHLMQGKNPGKCLNCGGTHGFTRCPNYGGISKSCAEKGCNDFKREDFAIDWVICGGESGLGARPMHPDWARGLRDQCKSAGVPFFFKQWGEWLPFYDRDKDDPDWKNIPDDSTGSGRRRLNLDGGYGFHGKRVVYFNRVGKKKAGCQLDGVEHKEYPDRKEQK